MSFKSQGIKQEILVDFEDFFKIISENEIDEEPINSPLLDDKCAEIFLKENKVIIQCTYCKSAFMDFTKYLTHLRVSHLKATSTSESDYLDSPKSLDDNMPSEFDPAMVLEMFSLSDDEINVSDFFESDENYDDYDLDIHEKVIKNEEVIEESNEDQAIESISNLEYDETWDRNISNEELITQSLKIEPSDPQFPCEICNQMFISEKCLKKHKAKDHENSDSFYDLSSNDESFFAPVTQVAENNDNVRKCRYCNREFKAKSERLTHERIHTGEKPFKCKICSKSFRTKNNLKVHISSHGNERPYKCKICDMAFKTRTNLSSHERRHTGVKKYKCHYCEKSFYKNTERKGHERSHTGEKPFQCNECGKCFTHSGHLLAHNQRHSGEKPYKCQYCDKQFYRKTNLKYHLIVHFPDINEKQFKCNVCGAEFLRKTSFNSHMKIHADVAEYECKICNKRFKQQPGLYSHMKSHRQVMILK